jgi:hypothetical protein
MRTSIRVAAIAAILVGASNLALAQGPVRQGLRGAAEITGDVAQGVAQGTANVARGVAQGTANVARGVGNATLNVAQGTGQALGLTPAVPYQARSGAIVDNSRDARWRFAQHNGEWWYYNDNNQWQYHRDGQWQTFSQDQFQPANQQLAQGQQFQGQHMTGYRGADQGQQVRHDQQGRAFICENGQAVYLDQQQAMPQEYGANRQDLGDQSLNQQPTPAEPTPADIQGQAAVQPAPSNAVPANSAPATGGQISGHGGADVSTAPAGPVASSEAHGSVAAPREINNSPTSQTNGAVENPGR